MSKWSLLICTVACCVFLGMDCTPISSNADDSQVHVINAVLDNNSAEGRQTANEGAAPGAAAVPAPAQASPPSPPASSGSDDDDDDDDDDEDDDLDIGDDDDDDDDDDEESGAAGASDDDDDDDDDDYDLERILDDILGDDDDDDDEEEEAPPAAAQSATQAAPATAAAPQSSSSVPAIEGQAAASEESAAGESAGTEEEEVVEEAGHHTVTLLTNSQLEDEEQALNTNDIAASNSAAAATPASAQSAATPGAAAAADSSSDDDDDDDDEEDDDIIDDEDDDEEDDDEARKARAAAVNGPITIPSTYIKKYNRYVDSIFVRINKVLKKNYDPVNVRLETAPPTKKKPSNSKNTASKKKKKPSMAKLDTSFEQVQNFTMVLSSTEKIEAESKQAVKENISHRRKRIRQTRKPSKQTVKPGASAGGTSNKPIRAKATLYGLSTLRRDGDVTVNVLSTHTTVKSKFLVGPLMLKVEKEFGRGAKKEVRSATATTAEMLGRLNLKVVHGGDASLNSIKVMQPKQMRVETPDDNDRTREFLWRRSSNIAHLVSQKLTSATKSILQQSNAAPKQQAKS